jgi:type I restriction-modification system DNA methylase subunit
VRDIRRFFRYSKKFMADTNLSSFIWSVADLLRGDYKQSEYGKVILPFTVLRRLDCVLEPTKAAVLTELAKREKAKLNPEPFLLRTSGQLFYNTSPLDMKKLMGDQDHIGENLRAYMQAFSPAVRDIFEKVNDLFEGDLTDQDKLVYVNDVIKGKLLESEKLRQQAASNSKEQFANSPDIKNEIMSAIMAALEAHTTLSTQALDSETVRAGIKDVLLNHAGLYESLRAK